MRKRAAMKQLKNSERLKSISEHNKSSLNASFRTNMHALRKHYAMHKRPVKSRYKK